MQHHPDRNPGNPEAEEKFKEATEAYTILADSEKRAMYDRFGHAGVGGSAAGAAGFDATIFQDFSDIFGDFFGFGDLFGSGGTRRRGRSQRGGDLREDLTLEFDEAVFGTSTEVKIRRHESCEDCRGTGAAAGKSPRPGALSARIFQHRAYLSQLPGRWLGDYRSLCEVQGTRPRGPGTHD